MSKFNLQLLLKVVSAVITAVIGVLIGNDKNELDYDTEDNKV